LYYFEENEEIASRILSNGNSKNEQEMDDLIEQIRQSSSIEKSLEEANEFIERSTRTLLSFPDSIERKALSELAEFIINRIN
ncbi:MAG: hypothetical protein N2C13_03460, partial [Chloroflexota bacterium]